MEFLAAPPHGDDQVGGLQQPKVLGDCLAGHVEMLTKFAEGLTVIHPQNIQQFSAAGICERLKNFVLLHGEDNMEPNGCMSRIDFSRRGKSLGPGRPELQGYADGAGLAWVSSVAQ